MKTILVPTDFSNNAYCALFYAAKLFEKEPSRFIILNSFEDQLPFLSNPINSDTYEKAVDALQKNSESECLAVQHKLKNDIESIAHTFEIKTTPIKLANAINQFISKESVDLVVMGSKGKTFSNNMLLGSNSVEVLQKIKNAPLLIIPDELDYSKPTKIGFATGFKYRYDKSQLAVLLNLSERFQSEVKILYISEDKKLNEDQKANFNHLFKITSDVEPELNWLQETESKYETLMDYTSKEQLDLLALPYHKHSFITNLFRENVVKNIAFNITIPLYILPSAD